MRILAVMSTLALFAGSLGAQAPAPAPLADSLRRTIEAGAETADLPLLEGAVALSERAIGANPADALIHYYHAYGLYRAGTLVLGREGSGKARPYFERARDELEGMLRGSADPEAEALLSGVYGMQIATARIQFVTAMKLGPKSNDMGDAALKLAPRNPRVWLIRGIGAYNAPSAFGGGMDKAETDLRKAIELFASDSATSPMPSWGLADAHAWLGRVYVKERKLDAARAEYVAALAAQPRNFWVKSVLVPELDAMIRKQ